MAYVITQSCCKDGSCVPVCPVDCIRPAGAAGEFTGTDMLYIDPVTCIDCNACVDACPVDAIYVDHELPANQERFREFNAAYFQRNPLEARVPAPVQQHAAVDSGSLRVAVIGSGPAACYAAGELLKTAGVQVDLFERLPTPFGLIRAGVAPDHQQTKGIVSLFERAFVSPQFGCYLNVEIGNHLSHDDLLRHYHAVVYAVGASKSRELGIPGQALAGYHPAADFVGWYNGHPDHAGHTFDLSGERAVIIGDGNVAVDVARVLVLSPAQLAQTDVAQYALDALSDSRIREVVILGRRGPRDAAFSVSEFVALAQLPGVDVIVDSDDLEPHPDDDAETALKLDVAREYTQRQPSSTNKRIVFRFLTSATEAVGGEHITGLRVTHRGGADDPDLIEASLVLCSIGYQCTAIDGLPFDPGEGHVPNDRGRLLDEGRPVPGVYVTGWIKRGPRGVIGTNRACAEETVAQLWDDFDAGRLTRGVQDAGGIRDLLNQRGAESVDWHGWHAIDAAERQRGEQVSRPRVKLTDVAAMVAAARSDVGDGS